MRKQGLQKVVTIITIISIVITIISLGFNLILPKYLAYKLNGELGTVSSIGIIGGADGPTAVYITSQLSPYISTYIFLLVSIVGILYLFFTRKMVK
ncbi:sodium ion-translocating decarboxylase subunit beta [Tissierella pigra]|uniref:sodium ion-translocating decarboxylase subunit beta n=1 Tax=Tissierella pigra TaxID=2607614 RepID=UPI001C123082|nr:sodium ion-translocating decarboxylase subunit beta [Tissierella pigra]MBU5427587.1 sodium ion-translocating decarboxylase subunit beta [Tissierella pigra]